MRPSSELGGYLHEGWGASDTVLTFLDNFAVCRRFGHV